MTVARNTKKSGRHDKRTGTRSFAQMMGARKGAAKRRKNK